MEDRALESAPDWVWWVAGSVFLLVPAGLALGRLWFWVRTKSLEHRMAERTAARDHQDASERSALDAANEIIELLNAQITAQGTELTELRRRLDQEREDSRLAMARATKCEADHAATKANLKLVALWASKKGLAMTSELKRLIDEDGSSVHTVAQTSPGGDQK